MALYLATCILVGFQSTEIHPLWPKGQVPMAKGTEAVDIPTITVWDQPGHSNPPRPAVVICPGGGYGGLANGHEGKDPAEYLTKLGIQAFVLKYRLGPKYGHPVPMTDCQRAIQWVRANAKKYQVDPMRIGVWGFSAGGHLASTVSTKFNPGTTDSKDLVDQVSSRPDFSILCYPVISMEPPVTHGGSRNNLLGKNPDPALVKSLSNHLQVTSKTPPTFLFHTREDQAVPIQNSDLYADALKKAKVPYAYMILEKGPHGVGLGGKDPILSQWPKKLESWLKENGFAPQ